MKLPKNRDIRAVIDTMIFVPAIAAFEEEGAFYLTARRKCWKFVFSRWIIEEYERRMKIFGYPSVAILRELDTLRVMNKYRSCKMDPVDVPDELAPRKDRHIVSPCIHSGANVIVSNDGKIFERREAIHKKTGAVVLRLPEAMKALKEMDDCGPER